MRPFNATPLNCGRSLLSLRSEPDYSYLTPAHLIAHLIQLSVKNSGENFKDPDYTAEYCPRDVLFHKCQKHQRKLDQFWSVWSSHFREALDALFKCHRGEISLHPVVVELYLIKASYVETGTCEVSPVIL